jgi:hypothetical protein
MRVGMIVRIYWEAWRAYIKGKINPTAFKKAPRDLSLISVILFQRGSNTALKA